jgi:folate-dependent phosphoribosylglycinamide formyltransferase PurN
MFSSSSGETFRSAYAALSPEARSQLAGVFFDRACAARQVAAEIVPSVPVVATERAGFEAAALAWMQQHGFKNGIVFLCGFFGILSEAFLRDCPAPIVNTHPSLLPAFPGLEKKVHAQAADTVCLSGFSVHLVTPELDGGPILFQMPVFLDPRKTPDALRGDVRACEQRWLPRIWEKLLGSDLSAADARAVGRELRARLGLHNAPISEREVWS